MKPKIISIPSTLAAAGDYEALARDYLDPRAWAYLSGAAADEISHHANRIALDDLRLNQRVLADVAGGHTRFELFGKTYAHPVFLAPIAYQKLFHEQGEVAAYQAASAMQSVMILSTLASITMEDVAKAAHGPLWFQLYIQSDRGFTDELVARAEAVGCEALVITVDAPINALRNAEQRASFQLPPGIEAANLRGLRAPVPFALGPQDSMIFDSVMRHAPTWRDIEHLRSRTKLPLVLKGIMHAEDARQAQRCGADALVISNHGGRIFDGQPAGLAVLPEITENLNGALPLLYDGGIKRGTDVLKALALGASAVLVGRAAMYGLSVAGASGVAHVLNLIRQELEVAMALTGCHTLADVGPQVLRSK